MRTNFLITWAIVVFICFVGNASAGVPRDPYKFFFSPTLGDLPEHLGEAKNEGKKGVLLFFEMDECPFCHRMKATVLNQPEVQDYYKKNYIILSIDVEGSSELVDFEGNDTTEKAFFEQVARNRGATPVFAFFDLKGELVVRYTGATSGVEEFMWLGQYASEGLYKETTFTKYKRERRQEGKSK